MKTRDKILAQIKRQGSHEEAIKVLRLFDAISKTTGGVNAELFYSFVNVDYRDNKPHYTLRGNCKSALEAMLVAVT